MLFMYLGVYTICLALLWWLFIVAKIHAYKFSNFSKNIKNITNILLIFLITLSLLWYILIFLWTNNTTSVVDDYSWFDTNEVNY